MAKSYLDEAGGEQRRRTPEKARFDLGEYVLTQAALAFLTSNASVTHRLKTKILEFLEYVDEQQYAEQTDLVWRLKLARGIGQAIIKHGARALPAVEHRVLEDTEWEDWHAAFFDTYRNNTGHAAEGSILENELSDEDVRYLDGYISTRLRYSYLWTYQRAFAEIATSIDTGDLGGDIETFNTKVMTVMERLVQKGRQAKALSVSESQDFHTGEVTFEAAIRSTHVARNRPQSMVRTGVRLLNDMLGGGYESGRVYIHFGRSGDGKTGLLCSVALWACDPRYNPVYATRDPTRKPCVIFLSQEDGMEEVVERMISFQLGSHVNITGSDQDEMVQVLSNTTPTETCQLAFKYRASRSISTADLEAMIHDEYMRGYEVVMIVQDYIKRIKAVETYKDQRHLELGAIVDEFRTISQRYGIPIVTGMQLNRDAYTKFEAAIKSGRTDAVKDLGASNAGESINVFENADVVIFQGRVTSEALEGRMFLTMRRGKFRGRTKGGPDFFAQPFDLDDDGNTNEMKLVEDAHLPIRECAGLKDVGDGVQQMYDANGDSPAGGTSSEERRANRDAKALSSASAQPKRKSKGKEGPKRVVPEVAGSASQEYEPDAIPDL
jgi:replicative DNA helicase